MRRPSVFIGSSGEGLRIAQALQFYLEADADVTIWNEGVFRVTQSALESLLSALDRIDFAVMVLTADDLIGMKSTSGSPFRDNILFELGLFVGRLGRSRTYLLVNEDRTPNLPTDLIGAPVLRFQERSDGNVLASIGPAAFTLKEAIKDLQPPSSRPMEFYSCFISYHSSNRDFVERIYTDLQEVGIRCWLDTTELRVGENIQSAINQAIRMHDKVLVVLSKPAIESAWIQREIQRALEIEETRDRTVLFPVRIDNAVLETEAPYFDELIKTRYIGDFTQWRDPKAYKQAFSRLVRDLTISVAVEAKE